VVQKTIRSWSKNWAIGARLSLVLGALMGCAAAQPARAESVITAAQPILLAQVPSPGVLPTDATKGNMLQDQAVAYPGFKLRLWQKFPTRMWVQGSTEVTQRLDTNVFLNYKKPQPDYVFRVAPNMTVGYNILDQTSVYAQYFVIKDDYTVHHEPLTNPTTQSVAVGLRHYLPPMFKGRVSTYLDVQARELFQSRGLRQSDINPSVNIQYFTTQHLSFFGSVTLQCRGSQPFTGAQRELDTFYALSMYYRRGPWQASISNSFVTNLREPFFTYSVPAHGNVNMITDFELDRQIGKIQGLQVFVRAEPVFNWRSANAVGLSGFDFRLYSGVRVSFYKPSLLASVNQMKRALQQQDGDAQQAAGAKGKNKGKKKEKEKKDDKDKGIDPGTGGGSGMPGPLPQPQSSDPGSTSPSPSSSPSASPAPNPPAGSSPPPAALLPPISIPGSKFVPGPLIVPGNSVASSDASSEVTGAVWKTDANHSPAAALDTTTGASAEAKSLTVPGIIIKDVRAAKDATAPTKDSTTAPTAHKIGGDQQSDTTSS